MRAETPPEYTALTSTAINIMLDETGMIRRLNLLVGQEAKVSAAWLTFPDFELERLEQTYRRVDEHTYQYESGGGEFVTQLTVNRFGLVTAYPEFWEEERRSD